MGIIGCFWERLGILGFDKYKNSRCNDLATALVESKIDLAALFMNYTVLF
jgi:hypothetical protein